MTEKVTKDEIEAEFVRLNANYALLEGVFAKIYDECLDCEEFREYEMAAQEWEATETYKRLLEDGKHNLTTVCLSESDLEIRNNSIKKRCDFRDSHSYDIYTVKKDMLLASLSLGLVTLINRDWMQETK